MTTLLVSGAGLEADGQYARYLSSPVSTGDVTAESEVPEETEESGVEILSSIIILAALTSRSL